MSKTKKTKRIRAQKVERSPIPEVEEKYENPFGIKNFILLGLGLIILILGYYFLAQPANDPTKLPSEGSLSLNVAPVLLLVAYLIIIPIGLLIRKSKKEAQE